MIAILWDCFHEAIYRKVFLLMVAGALLFCVFEMYNIRFLAQSNGEIKVQYHGYKKLMPAVELIEDEWQAIFAISQGPGFFFSMFLVAPLLSTYLEKGSIELAFTKGISRKVIYLSRVLGAFSIYCIPILLFNALPVLYFAAHVDFGWARWFDAVFLQMFIFAGAFVVMAAAALSQRGQATVILSGYAFFMICAAMEARYSLGLEGVFWKRFLFNWMTLAWIVLPKPQELMGASRTFMEEEFNSWFALATTAVFIVVAAVLTAMNLKKKSF